MPGVEESAVGAARLRHESGVLVVRVDDLHALLTEPRIDCATTLRILRDWRPATAGRRSRPTATRTLPRPRP
jgi:hypothetical protein